MSRFAHALLLTAVLLAAAPAAQAATRVVDDDRKQCPSAGFTNVQAAVDAAQAGDTVRVCAGDYRHRVVIPAGKDGLQLRSATRWGATLHAVRHSKAIVDVFSRDVLVDGFHLTGPWPKPDRCSQVHMYEEAAVLIENTMSATVSNNHMDELWQRGCARWGMGVRTTFFGGLCSEETEGHIHDNLIEEFGAAGVNGYCGETVVEDNTIIGDEDEYQSRDGIYMYYWAEGEISGNDVSGADRGLRLEAYEEGGVAEDNTVHHNRIGIFVVEDAEPWTIRDNVLTANRTAGLLTQGEGGLFTGNRSTGSKLDCGDYGTGNTWTGNVGATMNKPGLCKKP